MDIARILASKIGRPLLPGIPHLPHGTSLLFGHRLASLSFPRKLIGFYLPDIGIFDIEGRFVGERYAKTKTIQENQSQVLVDKNGKALALVRLEVRAAYDPQKNQIVGVLQSFEPFIAPDDDDVVPG